MWGAMQELSGRSKGRSSERIAEELLRKLGYTVIEKHKRIIIRGVEVGEVDLVARDPEGETYAVEVKAGRLDVGGIRQSYTNAMLLGLKPLVVCKAFADDAARELAMELNVKVIEASDYYLVSAEELEVIVGNTVRRVMDEYMSLMLTPTSKLGVEELRIFEAVAKSSSPAEAARTLNMSIEELLSRIKSLVDKGAIPKYCRRYRELKKYALIVTFKKGIVETISEILEEQKRILSLIEKILGQQY